MAPACDSANLSDQASRQLDREHVFGFGNSKRGRSVLGMVDIAVGLTRREPLIANQALDNLGRRLFLLQPLKDLVHAPRMLGGGCSIQLDTTVILFVTYRQLIIFGGYLELS
jgi:hypothetical protein